MTCIMYDPKKADPAMADTDHEGHALQEPAISAQESLRGEAHADSKDDSAISNSVQNRSVRESLLELNASIHRLLGIIVVGGALYTCYFAAELILPILLAVFLALLLSPLMNRLSGSWLPRWIAALLLILISVSSVIGIGNALYAPASEWVAKAPKVMRNVTPKLRSLMRPIEEANKVGESLSQITGEGKSGNKTVVVQAPPKTSLLTTTPRVLASVLAVILLTYFFLLYGDTVMRRTLLLRPTWQQKRNTVDIVRSIQNDLSRYFLTVCSTSILLGLATSVLLWVLKVENPVLWGAMAALLNLTPYVGPLIMVALLSMVGLSQFPTLGMAFLPAAGYMGLHLLESQVATPLALGQTINLNPLAIILWLMIWGWLWGILGLLLAVPMLVCLKVICSRVEGLQGWATMLEK